MTNSSSKLIDIVGDILNVSRLDLGRITIAAHPIDVSLLVAACIRDVRPLADEKRVAIQFVPSVRLPKLVVDETILTQITHNLLTNAIRYTPRDTGKITVEFTEETEGYVLAVHDNGIGIPVEAQEHIFERFYRAKNALGMDAQGSGLGLYLIKVMTGAFGGKVWFETVATGGTTFYVQIPRHGMKNILDK
jgi:signal transduction histidine kinase